MALKYSVFEGADFAVPKASIEILDIVRHAVVDWVRIFRSMFVVAVNVVCRSVATCPTWSTPHRLKRSPRTVLKHGDDATSGVLKPIYVFTWFHCVAFRSVRLRFVALLRVVRGFV